MTAPNTQTCLPGFEPQTRAPVMPTPFTRDANALAALIADEWVDQAGALDSVGTWRLADAVYCLRALGWPIQSEAVTIQSAASGKPIRVARYRLDRSAASLPSVTREG